MSEHNDDARDNEQSGEGKSVMKKVLIFAIGMIVLILIGGAVFMIIMNKKTGPGAGSSPTTEEGTGAGDEKLKSSAPSTSDLSGKEGDKEEANSDQKEGDNKPKKSAEAPKLKESKEKITSFNLTEPASKITPLLSDANLSYSNLSSPSNAVEKINKRKSDLKEGIDAKNNLLINMGNTI